MNKWYQEIIVLNKEIDGSMFYCFDEENYKKISDEREEQLKEIERLNNIIKHTDSWIDRTMEVIKQQPSEDDTWILERLNGIKKCLKGVDKE